VLGTIKKYGRDFKTDNLSSELKDKVRLINVRAEAQSNSLEREVLKLREDFPDQDK
jgi:uncharacterized protein YqkB